MIGRLLSSRLDREVNKRTVIYLFKYLLSLGLLVHVIYANWSRESGFPGGTCIGELGFGSLYSRGSNARRRTVFWLRWCSAGLAGLQSMKFAFTRTRNLLTGEFSRLRCWCPRRIDDLLEKTGCLPMKK